MKKLTWQSQHVHEKVDLADQTAIIERVTKSQKAKCAQTIESLNPVQVLS